MGSILGLLGVGSTTTASGATGVGVNVNVTIDKGSVIDLFMIGAGLIVLGGLTAILVSWLKKKSA